MDPSICLRRKSLSTICPASFAIAARLMGFTLVELALSSVYERDRCDTLVLRRRHSSHFIHPRLPNRLFPLTDLGQRRLFRRNYFFPTLGEWCLTARANRGARGITELRRRLLGRTARSDLVPRRIGDHSQLIRDNEGKAMKECRMSLHKLARFLLA